MKKLSKESHKHPHLISLLATYEHKRVYSLVFPLAKADLFGFWELNAQPTKTEAMAQWLAEQCRGLAEGLQHIHHWETFSGSSIVSDPEYVPEPPLELSQRKDTATLEHEPIRLIGRHGDVKPENILWFLEPRSANNYGILKITDFGIARFSNTYSRQGHMPNSPSYRSPEYELHESHSPACDVWALGCVYLELTTWYCGGYELLMRAVRDRLARDPKLHGISSDTFFTIYELQEQPGKKQAKVKESVATVSATPINWTSKPITLIS